MKLTEALQTLREQRAGAPVYRTLLACGFTPLHLKTFLAAELARAMPGQQIEVATGLFGDLAGTLESLAPESVASVSVFVEWEDLDPRLGVRTLGGWKVRDLRDIVVSACRQLDRISASVAAAARHSVIACSLPTLPLPPLFFTAGREASVPELELRSAVARCAATLVDSGVRLVRQQRLDDLSPLARRFDLKSEVAFGFPYELEHASTLAAMASGLLGSSVPKKALITDLDDTFWFGILGEAGVSGVAWDLENHAQMHGIYQQFLASLASAGVLVAVASKNDSALASEALRRPDILCGEASLFPVEANWGPKSASVRRILNTWNIAADAVIFIDDSPMEVAEVQAAFPDMESIVFPGGNYRAFWEMLEHLRDEFGKSAVREEDELRLRSLREAPQFQSGEANGAAGNPDAFLQDADGHIEFSSGAREDARAFELINKTNQFNLNGRRWEAGEWRRYFEQPGAFLVTAAYRDKYGPLGKIAVLAGIRNGRRASVPAWVMSCRAFSRRIEHQCLDYLFRKFELDDVVFDYAATSRNGPMAEFLASVAEAPPDGPFSLTHSQFQLRAPALFHGIEEKPDK